MDPTSVSAKFVEEIDKWLDARIAEVEREGWTETADDEMVRVSEVKP